MDQQELHAEGMAHFSFFQRGSHLREVLPSRRCDIHFIFTDITQELTFGKSVKGDSPSLVPSAHFYMEKWCLIQLSDGVTSVFKSNI